MCHVFRARRAGAPHTGLGADQFKGRDLYDPKNRLTAEQLAKGWSVVNFLILDDAKKFAAFVTDAKTGPGDSPVEREVSAVLNNFRIPR